METLHKVFKKMTILILSKLEHIKKKKNFYKNFISKSNISSNFERDYENLEKIA